MTIRVIRLLIKNLYGAEVSHSLVSEIKSSLDVEFQTQQTQRLKTAYPMRFIEGIVVHVRAESGNVSII